MSRSLNPAKVSCACVGVEVAMWAGTALFGVYCLRTLFHLNFCACSEIIFVVPLPVLNNFSKWQKISMDHYEAIYVISLFVVSESAFYSLKLTHRLVYQIRHKWIRDLIPASTFTNDFKDKVNQEVQIK